MRIRTSILVLVSLSAVGCSSPAATEPEPEPGFIGSYAATRLESVFFGEAVDHLANGAQVFLELRRDGSAEVDLEIPGAGEGGGHLRQLFVAEWWIPDFFYFVPMEVEEIMLRRPESGPDSFVVRRSFLWFREVPWLRDSLRFQSHQCGFVAEDVRFLDCRIDMTLTCLQQSAGKPGAPRDK